MAGDRAAGDPQGYLHEALFFTSRRSLAEEVVPFLREGLVSGDEAVLVCDGENNRALFEALGEHERVTCLPRPQVYGEAVTAVAYFRDFMRSRARDGGRRVRLVGQVDFGRDARAWDEWRRFEALCNHALAPYPLWSVCAYDAGALPDALVATGELTHPYLRKAGASVRNSLYVDPTELLTLPATDLDPMPEIEPAMSLNQVWDLHLLQHQLRRLLREDGVDADLADDLVVAVNEVATNGVRHGHAPVSVRVWLSPERVACTVTDQGPGFTEPVTEPEPLPYGRFGLWLARQLCDELVTMRTPEGFTVRLVVRR